MCDWKLFCYTRKKPLSSTRVPPTISIVGVSERKIKKK